MNAKTLPLLLLVIVGLTASITFRAVAHRPGATPVTLATVDIVRVLGELNQRADAEAELRTFVAEIEEEDTRRLEELRGLEQQLETLPVGSPERRALEDDIERRLLNLQYWYQLQREKQDVEISLILQDLYRVITEAIAELAAVEGYDVVIVNDSVGEMSFNPDAGVPREAQIRQQISGRQLLYVREGVDITDDLIQRMNNRHDAGG